MRVNIGEDIYEIDNTEANEIFEQSKMFTHAVIDYCESNKMDMKKATYHLMACACHFNHLIQRTIDSMGEERFIKMMDAVEVKEEEK